MRRRDVTRDEGQRDSNRAERVGDHHHVTGRALLRHRRGLVSHAGMRRVVGEHSVGWVLLRPRLASSLPCSVHVEPHPGTVARLPAGPEPGEPAARMST